MNKKVILVVLSLFLTNCASITTGKYQSVSVGTFPEIGAMCQLTNDKGMWHVNNTPGSATVNRSYSDLVITCTKDNKSGITQVKSSIKGMTAGNIIAGGVIGFAVDAGTGSGYDYPSTIMVQLR